MIWLCRHEDFRGRKHSKLTVLELQTMGHDVLDIRGTPQQGMLDDELWALAQSEQRLLVTTDKGFTAHR